MPFDRFPRIHPIFLISNYFERDRISVLRSTAELLRLIKKLSIFDVRDDPEYSGEPPTLSV